MVCNKSVLPISDNTPDLHGFDELLFLLAVYCREGAVDAPIFKNAGN